MVFIIMRGDSITDNVKGKRVDRGVGPIRRIKCWINLGASCAGCSIPFLLGMVAPPNMLVSLWKMLFQ